MKHGTGDASLGSAIRRQARRRPPPALRARTEPTPPRQVGSLAMHAVLPSILFQCLYSGDFIYLGFRNLFALAILNKKNVAIEPLPADFKPHIDLRDLALLFNSVTYFKNKQVALPIEAWAKDSTLHEFFPEIDYVQSFQDYYHQKPLRALEKMALLADQANEPTKRGISKVIESWHQATASNQVNPNLSSAKQTREAHIKYPFSVPVLQKSTTLLPKKEAYEER